MEIQEIVLIGLEERLIQVIGAYLGCRYHFIAINRKFDIRQLKSYQNIILFIVDSDQPFIEMKELIPALKAETRLENIPIIGLALKQHYMSLDFQIRNRFEDILLMPCGNEDLLMRIEVWTRTYEILKSEVCEGKTYSLDSI